MKVELLSPAGNFEKLKSAVSFGADAVYLAGKNFGLRAASGNFTIEDMANAFSYLRKNGKKGYVTLNIYARNYDIEGVRNYLNQLEEIEPDALIVSDPGIVKLIRDSKFPFKLHISTQANVTNYMAVKFWEDMGAERIVLARELNKDEISYICNNCSAEIEVFVHGAMCISHSGRCVLSNYFNNKDANKGECTHPCRWNYALMEETRPGEYLPVYQDERGTYIYNSKDLSLLSYMKELLDIGVKSFKIEGRMKSAMYTSVVTGVYRKAIDSILNNEEPDYDKLFHLLESVSNRGYTDGFFNNTPTENSMNYKTSAYSKGSDFIGIAEHPLTNLDNKFISFLCKGKISIGDVIHILHTDLRETEVKIDTLLDENLTQVEFTRPNYKYFIPFSENFTSGSLIRKYL